MKPKHIYLLAIIILQIIMLSIPSPSKDFSLQEFKEKLPKLLGSTNAGKDFWITFNPCWETSGAKNDLKIYVSSEYTTKVTVEIPGKGYLRQQTTIPNGVIEFTLTPELGQCYRKTDRQAPQPDQVFSGYGIHVYAEQPIIVYGVTRYQYTSDSYLALPVSSLGKEYVVASWPDISDYGLQYLPSYTAIVSPYDNNKVSFTMGGTLTSRTAGDQMPRETRNYTLYKGDVLLISSAGQRADLSGSKINSTKPVGVISSNFCAYVPENTPACDFMCEMELPTYTMGKLYLYTPIYGRLKNSIIRIFALENNTTIYKDNIILANLDSANGLYGENWISIRADAGAPRPILFSGDKSIYIIQYNTGQLDDGVQSDPFMMVLIPYEQFQKELILCTPGIKGGLGFTTNYVNIVYNANDNGEIPDDLEFATVQNGKFVWKKMREIDSNPGQPFSNMINGKKYNNKSILLPGVGDYKIRANNPIAAYAYGFSSFDSYGHPASVSTFDLSKNDSFPPKPTWSTKCFGLIEKAKVEDMPQNPVNRTNLSLIVFHYDSSYNYNFSYDDFIPREDSITNWNASVIDITKEARAIITFSDGRGNDTTILIEYYPKDVNISSDSVFFGNIIKGIDTTLNMFIYNYTKSAVVIDSIYLKYKNKGFEILAGTMPDTLLPGDTLFFGVKFTATEDGAFSDSVGVAGDCFYKNPSRAIVTALSGTASIEVSDKDFGKIKINNLSNPYEIEIKNKGALDLVINEVKGPSDPNAFIVTLREITLQNPLIIPPFQHYLFDVTFYPTEAKNYIDTIYFMSNSEKDSQVDSIAVLNGIGQTDIGPAISVSNADFGYVERYTTNTKNIEIKNTGDKNLTITDYRKPKYYLFNALINPDITPANPKTLPPNKSWNFDIEFNSEAETNFGFKDSIIFNSNAVSGDSIALLNVDSVVILSVEDFSVKDKSLRVTPNPFSTLITVGIIGNNKSETIILYDIFGRTVLTKETELLEAGKTYDFRLPTDDLPQGVYFVRVQSRIGIKTIIKVE